MRRVILAAAVALLALALPAAASAQYVLKHPKREHCRAHYVKKVQHRETVCIQLIPTFTLVEVSPIPGGDGGHTIFGEVGIVGSNGRDLIGAPIAYAVADQSAGRQLASFTGVSNPIQPCSFMLGIPNEAETTFAGESIAPYSGCPFASVGVPDGQITVLTGSFAGNGTYAPSTGEATL
jgi:hypothetical protein